MKERRFEVPLGLCAGEGEAAREQRVRGLPSQETYPGITAVDFLRRQKVCLPVSEVYRSLEGWHMTSWTGILCAILLSIGTGALQASAPNDNADASITGTVVDPLLFTPSPVGLSRDSRPSSSSPKRPM